MKKVYFDYNDDIIDPCWDIVFKAVFTKDAPESKEALRSMVSALIDREVTSVTVTVNEPPASDTNNRQIRYDINCKLSDGELANVEMTMNPDTFETLRLEYYLARLFAGQEIKGNKKTYKDLTHTYQISFIAKNKLFGDKEFMHNFRYYDSEHGVSLNGRTHIITIELAKLDKIVQKNIENMTSKERWALFFKYSADRNKRDLVNKIIEVEEGIAMAGNVLQSISKDEAERFRITSEMKYELDHRSGLVNARDEGRVEGRIEGKLEGKLEIAKKLVAAKMPDEQIEDITGLPISDIIDLKH